MSIFENLFKRNKNESSQTENLDEHFDFLEFMRKSAIHLIKKQNLILQRNFSSRNHPLTFDNFL
jgi:hypothetical protein